MQIKQGCIFYKACLLQVRYECNLQKKDYLLKLNQSVISQDDFVYLFLILSCVLYIRTSQKCRVYSYTYSDSIMMERKKMAAVQEVVSNLNV